MRRALRSTVIVLLAVLLPRGAARAQESAPQKDPRELEAKKACLAGRAEQGIELLAALYAETNDPTYIYNQARCFEQNGKAPEAVARFREYLRKAPAVVPDEKAQVQAHITELEAQARQAAATPAVVIAPAAAPTKTSGEPPREADPTTNASADSSADGNARSLRIAAIAAAGVGVLALAGGIAMGLRAGALEDEVTRDAGRGTFDRGKYDDGQQAVTWQWVGYGVAAAGLAASGLLFYLSSRPPSAADGPRMTALPTLRPDGVGAALRMTF